MDGLDRRWELALAGSLGVHLVLALLLGVSLSSKPTSNRLAAQPKIEVVQAVAINEQQILKELERRSNLERARDRKEKERKEGLEQDAAKAKKRRQQEERKIAALKKKQKQERLKQQKAKQLAEKKSREAEVKERQRLATLKKEQERLKAQQKQLEDVKRAEEALLKKIEDDRIAAQTAAFESKMAVEQRRLDQVASQTHQRKLAVEKSRYMALIAEKVTRNWVKPPGTKGGDSCKVLVQQIPGGEVIDVKVTACNSGSAAFRDSVTRAVWKTKHLPTPTMKELFDREIEFTFTP